jgi:hypothetical protein
MHGVSNDGVCQALRRLQFVCNTLLPFLGATTWFLGNGNGQGLGALSAVVHGGAKTFNVVHNVKQFVMLWKFPRSNFDGRNV